MKFKNCHSGFTLMESLVVMSLFVVAVLISSQMYLNLTQAAIVAQESQLALDNFRFGAEKIWSEIKNGNNFNPSTSSLDFKDRHCRPIKIYKQNNNLIYEINNQQFPFFDERLVSVKKFEIYYDNPLGNGFYYKNANKIFVLHYQVDLKTKKLTIPFEFWQTVAPANSIFLNNPCP